MRKNRDGIQQLAGTVACVLVLRCTHCSVVFFNRSAVSPVLITSYSESIFVKSWRAQQSYSRSEVYLVRVSKAFNARTVARPPSVKVSI